MLDITDADRVRTLRLNRPEAKNAMNEAMWDLTTEAFMGAADDPDVAVIVMTGTGDAFCAGADLAEMALGNEGSLARGKHGFQGLAATMIDFPKPVLLAINGLGVGFGATVIGVADLVFMARGARLRCPFTALGLAPEFASSSTFPTLIGRQNATWTLMSSEWLSAEECHEMGLVFKLCEPDELMDVTMAHARTLASKPISSLVATKDTIVAPMRNRMRAARDAEDAVYRDLLGGAANVEAIRAFAEKRQPDFTGMT